MRQYKYPIPVRHKQKIPFTPNIVVPQEFKAWNDQIGRSEEELNRYILRGSDYEDLLVEAWATNVHRSVSIEGNPLPIEEVRRLTRNSLAGKVEHKPDWPRQEVLNHLQVYAELDSWGHDWTVDAIQKLHRFLMSDSPPEVASVIRPGELRSGTEPGEVTSRTDESEVLFVTAPGTHVREELESLMVWVNTHAPGLHPIIAATILFHEFESIHPFEDGNGRTGRVLFQIYLQTHGLPNSHLCLVEQELMRDLETYYDVLAITDYEYSQARLAGALESYTTLIGHFTISILTSYRTAAEKCRQKDVSKDLTETAKRIIVEAKRMRGWFSLAEAVGWVSGCSQSTVSNYLNELTRIEVMQVRGETKSRRFAYADPLRNFHVAPPSGAAGSQSAIKPDSMEPVGPPT
ncbi:MAG: Fic family protein [Thermoplasmata archaeon]|nr:Fic family protein [Thermoplasmata archaeon]